MVFVTDDISPARNVQGLRTSALYIVLRNQVVLAVRAFPEQADTLVRPETR